MNKSNTIRNTFIAASIGMWIGLFGTLAFGAEGKPFPSHDKDGAMRDVATCADGKVYRNMNGDHRGACSGHGGVAKWSDGSPVKSHTKRTEYK